MIKHKVPVITVQELKKELKERDEEKPLVLLDTRELKEFKVSHIEDARHVGYKKFNLKTIAGIPKKTPIVVYCSLGVRSERIGEMLEKAGYRKVKNLLGGIFEWVNRGNPVVDLDKQSTQQVHAYKWSCQARRASLIVQMRPIGLILIRMCDQ